MSKHATVRCLFCGRGAPEVKMSKEHVLREFFQQHMEIGQWRSDYAAVFAHENGLWESVGRTVPVSPWQVTVREVCEPCNNVVLNSDIEKPVEDTLLALMRGTALVLLPVGCRHVATWAAKTAVVRAAMDAGKRVIPQAAARHIVEHLEPPPFTVVLGGHCAAPPNTWTRHMRMFFTFDDAPPEECHVTTLILGELFLQVLGAGGSRSLARLTEAAAPSVRLGHLVQLWPDPGVVLWPPSVQLLPARAVGLSDHGLQMEFPSHE